MIDLPHSINSNVPKMDLIDRNIVNVAGGPNRTKKIIIIIIKEIT